MKRSFKKIKNAFLIVFTVINFISLCICICSIESFESLCGFAVLAFNVVWLVLVAWANDVFSNKEYDEANWVEVKPEGYNSEKVYAWKRRG